MIVIPYPGICVQYLQTPLSTLYNYSHRVAWNFVHVNDFGNKSLQFRHPKCESTYSPYGQVILKH